MALIAGYFDWEEYWVTSTSTAIVLSLCHSLVRSEQLSTINSRAAALKPAFVFFAGGISQSRF